MKAIIIFGSMAMSVAMHAQTQQQQRQQIVLVNNLGNTNVLNNISFNNIQIQSNVMRHSQASHVTRAIATNNNLQVKASGNVKRPTTHARRRATPRPRVTVNIAPPNNINVQVVNDQVASNVFVSNEINIPTQNFSKENNSDLQVQNTTNIINNESNLTNEQKINNDLNSDLSLNLKGVTMVRSRSAGSGSSSSSHSRTYSFSKKMAKFKRHFFGKLSSHKKVNHHLDMCFNWK